MIFSDREVVLETAIRQLAARFHLTAAEQAVLQLLAGGHLPEHVAEQRGAGIGTIRVQIKRLLAKTGSKRQLELIKMIFNLPA